MRYLKPSAEMFLKAAEFYGVKEIPGTENNPTIVGWFDDIGHRWVEEDETAWCGCFMNWVALKCGCERSFKLDARSWLAVGEDAITPQLGDVAVLWRGSLTSWKGHVGLYAGHDRATKDIYLLGGNQDDMVNIKLYDKDRVLSYRRLRSA